MAYINGSLVIFRSSIFSREPNFISYSFKNSDILDVQSLKDKHNYTKIQNNFIDLYDYRFFNPSGESSYKNALYMLGSIKLKSLKGAKEDISKRFSSVKIDKGVATKEQWPFVPAPPNNIEFPDIEYGSALVERFGINVIKPLSYLYIIGGSKYISSKNSLEMIKHFSLFNFTSQAWEDLSGTLPKQLCQIAGHELISINGEKLIALGGYKTNSYTMEPRVTAVGPIFSSLKNIFVFDIKGKKWESKQTKITKQDEQILSHRKHYLTTAKYQNNKLYVYAGFESDHIKGSKSHYFGMLDLYTWAWRWYRIGFNSDLKDVTSTGFDSILVSNAMIVSHSDCRYNTNVKFFKFDLNLGYYSNLGSLSYQSLEIRNNSILPKTDNFPIGLFVFLVGAAVVIIASIILFLYRYYRSSRQSKGDEVRFETEDIWSDPSIYTIRNSNITNEHLRQYRLYQCFILQQLSSYTSFGQTFSYHEPEFVSIHESNTRTHADIAQNLHELPNNSECWDAYTTY